MRLPVILLIALFIFSPCSAQNDYIPADGVLRFYRLALPVTATCFDNSFDADVDEVHRFWDDAETFLNRLFIPMGFCFDVIKDDRLVQSVPNEIDSNPLNAPGVGTELLDAILSSDSYDIGMWLSEPANWDNSGVSISGGAYRENTCAGGYSQVSVITVAHELGHMFGALHSHDTGVATEPGLGQSIMGYGLQNDFFALAAIHTILSENASRNSAYYSDEPRTTLVGTDNGGNYVYGIKVEGNSAPHIDDSEMSDRYRIPQGACLAVDIIASDADGDRLTYAMQQYEDGASFYAYEPAENSLIDFRPKHILFPNDDYFYEEDGTCIPTMLLGVYKFMIAVNDLPHEDDYTYEAMKSSPFYSKYDVYRTSLEIVAGVSFDATLSPMKSSYSAGEEVTVSWGVNRDYFTADSKVRVTLSDDYGKSFKYTLVESVPACDGSCTVVLPDVNINSTEVPFGEIYRSMRAGIIRVEEVGGVAYTLTCLTPENGGGFLVTGGSDVPPPATDILFSKDDADGTNYIVYDLAGRVVAESHSGVDLNLAPGVYIVNGKKIIIR